jgi:MoaA/NifB/PqqE/SkfB family radical SAM enzyme
MTAMLPWLHLDTLWLQVTGTRCNIACRHCFISCGPKVERHAVMTRAQVEQALEDAARVGCRATYFTGGEPFLHPEILDLVELALRQGPLGILSNGMLLDDATCTGLRTLDDASDYSLDLRISLDGLTAEENDPIRGKGVFAAACEGIRRLAGVGLEPALAVTTVHAQSSSAPGRLAFLDLLKSLGVKRPRVKLIPPFLIGREAKRNAGYNPSDLLQGEDLTEESPWVLQCGSSRMVTAGGVYACPILIDHAPARMGDRLTDSLRPTALFHPACVTCHQEGFSCKT